MKKILIAIDGSECSLRAVEHAAKLLSGPGDIHVTLLHVLPYPPAPLWDEGHIPEAREREAREHAIEHWLAAERRRAEPLFDTAIALLAEAGMAQASIEKKLISDSSDAADSILEEARDGGYEVLIIGRCGLSGLQRLLLGSVTSKVVNRGTGVAVCIVE